ncbi:uncharacterized protein METZ01_LOCUS485908 [marine metagenome]|uniref:Uncharacterized protein n=1 Tax=marine metagenome TaxID=408172 RepID=A0A383CLN9_9ZZZZ
MMRAYMCLTLAASQGNQAASKTDLLWRAEWPQNKSPRPKIWPWNTFPK